MLLSWNQGLQEKVIHTWEWAGINSAQWTLLPVHRSEYTWRVSAESDLLPASSKLICKGSLGMPLCFLQSPPAHLAPLHKVFLIMSTEFRTHKGLPDDSPLPRWKCPHLSWCSWGKQQCHQGLVLSSYKLTWVQVTICTPTGISLLPRRVYTDGHAFHPKDKRVSLLLHVYLLSFYFFKVWKLRKAKCKTADILRNDILKKITWGPQR